MRGWIGTPIHSLVGMTVHFLVRNKNGGPQAAFGVS